MEIINAYKESLENDRGIKENLEKNKEYFYIKHSKLNLPEIEISLMY